MSTTSGRRDALSAIAVAAGRPTSMVVIEDRRSGFTSLVGGVAPRLDLLELDVIRSPRTWLFDEAPTGPTDGTPQWRGFLVHADPRGELSVVRMGDRAALVERWSSMAQWLSPGDLAAIVARYFGIDAGLPFHHSVIASSAEFRELAAPMEHPPVELIPPGLSLDANTGNATLDFHTTFIALARGSAPALGLCQWSVKWGPEEPVSWRTMIVGYFRSGFASSVTEP